MGLLRSFRSALLLRRVLRAADRIAAAVEESNRIAERRLKLEAIKANIPLSQLDVIEEQQEAPAAPGTLAGLGRAAKPPVEALMQSDRDLAEFEVALKAAEEAFPKGVPDDLDVVKWAKREGWLDAPAEEDEEIRVRVYSRPSG